MIVFTFLFFSVLIAAAILIIVYYAEKIELKQKEFDKVYEDLTSKCRALKTIDDCNKLMEECKAAWEDCKGYDQQRTRINHLFYYVSGVKRGLETIC